MRIFQVITVSEYGGAQTVVANLVKNLSPQHELFILYGGNGEAWSKLDNNFTPLKLSNHRKEVSYRDISLFFKLLYYRFKYKPDVVHLHSSKMGVLGRLAFSKKKTVLTIHGFDSVRTAFNKFLIIERLLKNRAFRIIGVSKYDAQIMKEEGISKNVEVIYNGVPDHSLKPLNTEDYIINELTEIKEKYNKIIMCISRISRQKKFDLFLDIAKEMPQHAFVWIGNKERIPDLPENVFCLGEVHSAFSYLTYANLFILPSNYEGLPISILEALAFGVPVVASAVGGVTELLDNNNGYAIENDVSVFKEKIESILSDEQKQKAMSEHARQSYLANFTIEEMVDNYKLVFDKIYSANKK